MKKVVYFVSGSIIVLALAFYVCKSPLFFAKTPLANEQIEPQFCNASLDYHHSLSPSDLAGIYMCFLEKQDDSIFVSASLLANAGAHCGGNADFRSIPLDTSAVHTIERYWRSKNFASKFFHENDSVTVNRSRPANAFRGLLYLSPVKMIHGELFVGMQYWCGPLCGSGNLYKLEKVGGRWVNHPVGLGWIS